MTSEGGCNRANIKVSLSSINSKSPFHLSDSNWDTNEENIEQDGFFYKVLSADQIVDLQRDIIDEVTNVLELSPQVSRTLLNHFQWDKERLLEQYFESSPQEFFQRSHVLNPFEEESAINPSLVNTACEICYKSDQQLDGLGCGHIYCIGCWKMYLANKTCSAGLSHTITCPAANCDILVDYVTFLELADDPQVLKLYKQLITNTFVEFNSLMRWCPAPNCTNAIEANYKEAKAVKCKCGHKFCFGCGENWHEPVACSWLKKWLSLTVTDLESYEWIEQNTKRCPLCRMPIQKNGGCDHMICTYRCSYEFCWQCLGKWHKTGNCHIYPNLSSVQAAHKTKARFKLYKDRYMNHLQSLKKEHKFYAYVPAGGADKQEEISWIEAKFLRDAIVALRQCRSTLMYSYVFAFYLEDNNQKVIFEYNQRDLEMATEKISECLELQANNLHSIKQRLIELSKYCQKRRRILLNHVLEGNEKNWWDFIKEATLLAAM